MRENWVNLWVGSFKNIKCVEKVTMPVCFVCKPFLRGKQNNVIKSVCYGGQCMHCKYANESLKIEHVAQKNRSFLSVMEVFLIKLLWQSMEMLKHVKASDGRRYCQDNIKTVLNINAFLPKTVQNCNIAIDTPLCQCSTQHLAPNLWSVIRIY